MFVQLNGISFTTTEDFKKVEISNGINDITVKTSDLSNLLEILGREAANSPEELGARRIFNIVPTTLSMPDTTYD